MARLNLPQELTLSDLIGRVADIQQKRIVFEGFRGSDAEKLTSLWLNKPDEGLILYRFIDSHWYRVHGICHELAHILLGHFGCEFSDLAGVNVIPGITASRRVDTLQDNPLEAAAEELAYELGRRLKKNPYVSREPETVFG